MSATIKIKTALLSVSNKDGIIELAAELHRRGIKILSTGGTAKLLQQQKIEVVEVSEHTGFPEIMAGRVKTLHPKIHGGLLRRPGIDDEVIAQQNIEPIDLVVVNLYPFEQAIATPNCSLENAIENIDIGGPTMLRAAAKNHAAVTVVVDPQDYPNIIGEMSEQDGSVSNATRFTLAKKVFAHTAKYDAAIANYLGAINADTRQKFPTTFSGQWVKQQDLRYGENPHQDAAFYADHNQQTPSIANAKQWQGKELSFNNIADTDTALECVKQFKNQAACVIVKHANPCGVALDDNQLTAYERAFSTDPTSAFGGIIAFNQTLEAETAKAIVDKQFVEVIIAPKISEAALNILAAKKNVRALSCGQWQDSNNPGYDFKRVNGGLLIQDQDLATIDKTSINVVSKRQPTDAELTDLLFAWKVAKFVKSNAIVYTKDNMTIGIGAGQMSRVYSARIAGIKAEDEGLTVAGSVMASDAFFPFRDGIDAAAKVGITAVIQPGGSIRDEEVIAAADEANMAMVFTNIRHFRH